MCQPIDFQIANENIVDRFRVAATDGQITFFGSLSVTDLSGHALQRGYVTEVHVDFIPTLAGLHEAGRSTEFDRVFLSLRQVPAECSADQAMDRESSIAIGGSARFVVACFGIAILGLAFVVVGVTRALVRIETEVVAGFLL